MKGLIQLLRGVILPGGSKGKGFEAGVGGAEVGNVGREALRMLEGRVMSSKLSFAFDPALPEGLCSSSSETPLAVSTSVETIPSREKRMGEALMASWAARSSLNMARATLLRGFWYSY